LVDAVSSAYSHLMASTSITVTSLADCLNTRLSTRFSMSVLGVSISDTMVSDEANLRELLRRSMTPAPAEAVGGEAAAKGAPNDAAEVAAVAKAAPGAEAAAKGAPGNPPGRFDLVDVSVRVTIGKLVGLSLVAASADELRLKYLVVVIVRFSGDP